MHLFQICFAVIFLLGLNLVGITEAHAQDKSWLNPEGMTVETRFPAPAGYERKKYEDPYTDYMRKLPMLPDGSPVMLFNGELKARQSAHVGVLDIDVGTRDLQQCSDAAQRLRVEYLYGAKKYDKINYHFTNGQALAWDKWRAGYRVKVEGRKTTLVKTAGKDDSYNNFKKYYNMLFMYASVNSVMKESKVLSVAEMQPGDSIAATGHLIIILDVVENAQGRKKFLLAQSYMPAQQIEVLKNPGSQSPWYDDSAFDHCPFVTPEWVYECPGPKIYRMP